MVKIKWHHCLPCKKSKPASNLAFLSSDLAGPAFPALLLIPIAEGLWLYMKINMAIKIYLTDFCRILLYISQNVYNWLGYSIAFLHITYA